MGFGEPKVDGVLQDAASLSGGVGGALPKLGGGYSLWVGPDGRFVDLLEFGGLTKLGKFGSVLGAGGM